MVYTTHLRPHIQSRQLGVCPVLAMNLLVEVKVDMEDAIVNGRVFFLLQVKKYTSQTVVRLLTCILLEHESLTSPLCHPKNCC